MANTVKAQVTFPATTCAYAWIDKPDSGHKFSDNKYKCTLVYDDIDDAMTVKEGGAEANLVEICHRLAVEEWGEDFDLDELRLPFRPPEDQTKDDFEGKTTITPKSQYKPMAYDAKRKKLPKSVKIFSGDVVATIGTLKPYESTEKVREGKKMVTVTTYGISIQMGAIQLVEKRAGGGAGPEGFDDYEDGFDGSGFDDDLVDDDDDNDGDDNGDY